jgi:hypothetical protein
MLLKGKKAAFTGMGKFSILTQARTGRAELLVTLFHSSRKILNAAGAVASWPHWLLLAVLAAVTAVYLPTLHDSFHGDDFVAFTEFKTHNFWNYSQDVFLFKDANFYWRPLGKISHFVLYEFWDFDPFPYRVFSLGVFLATLVALYVFCLREGLGRWVALGAALVFGLLPNHVVSVTWVTNNSRLMAVLFMLIAMLWLQTPGERRRWWQEAGAFVFMFIAAISDETSLALVPIPVLYATFVNSGPMPHGLSRKEAWHVLPIVLRVVFYAALVGILTPLQLEYGVADEPRLLFFGVGPHVVTQTWAITSQLVLPLTSASPIDLLVKDIPTVQWVAGALAIAGGALALVFGSRWLKLLVIWTALAIAPFTLWDLNYTSPRYVYMAAVPYAIILSWAVNEAVRLVLIALHFKPLQAVGLMGAAAGVALACIVSWGVIQDRDATWTAETAKYAPLADNLKLALKDPPKNGGRLIIYYGYWPDFWASAVARTVYGDKKLFVVNVPGKAADSSFPRVRSNDVVLYYLQDHFVQMGLASTR